MTPAPTSAAYSSGNTPFTASRFDPRLHYGLYVPREPVSYTHLRAHET